MLDRHGSPSSSRRGPSCARRERRSSCPWSAPRPTPPATRSCTATCCPFRWTRACAFRRSRGCPDRPGPRRRSALPSGTSTCRHLSPPASPRPTGARPPGCSPGGRAPPRKGCPSPRRSACPASRSEATARRSGPVAAAASHSQSRTSVLRPGTCLTCRALTSSRRKSLSSTAYTGRQYTPLFECDFSVRDDGPLASRLSTVGFPVAPWIMLHAGLSAPLSETTSALAVPDV